MFYDLLNAWNECLENMDATGSKDLYFIPAR